jgi:recombination protein RecA
MPRRATEATTEVTPESIQKLVNKKFGEGTMRFASSPELAITRLPTGILSIDWRLGGGFPRGRHVEMFGGYSVGKTYTALKLIATTQAAGGTCAFVDVEGSFDPAFAAFIGVDLESLAYHRQDHGNRVIDFIETLLRSNVFDVIVLDSIAALLPKSELESDMEGGSYGTAQAKLMSAALRRLTTANKNTVMVYINQTRDSIGSVFAKRSITSGGKAMGFYAGLRLEMVRVENIKKRTRVIDPAKGDESMQETVRGHRVLVRIEKDKTGGAKQHDQTTFVFDYELNGVDHIEDLMYIGRITGFVHKRTNLWWVEGYEDEKQNGRKRFKSWLRRNRAIAEELEENILNADRSENQEDEDEDDD